MPGSKLLSLCKKTQLCKFHQISACTKGQRCSFAHGDGELLDKPDLSSTKLCPQIISSGTCNDDKCQFAHSKNQLRRLATPQTQEVRKTFREPLMFPGICASFATMQENGTSLEQALASRTFPCIRSFDEVTECSTQDLLTDSSSIQSLSFDASDGGCATRQTSCGGEVEHAGDNGKQESDDTIKGPGRVVKNMFHKTRMCTFYAQGRCKKRSSCNFAHSSEELMPLPNLACTKLCPQLLSTGQCDRDGCTFAHCKEELQTGPSKRQHAPLKSMKRGLVDEGRVGACPEGPAGDMFSDLNSQDVPWSRHMSEDLSLLRITGLSVKNTFISFEDPEVRKPQCRSHSAPAHLCRGLAAPGESGEAATQAVRRRQRTCQTWVATAARPGLDQQQELAHSAMPDTSGVPALALPCLR
mmetsp:Transcript_72439/g.212275  ORF Transcript_72439/g.212275 Transcript_72439/m.212275 type:complete len:413 (+) Transcript_72439:69-1307(+)